MKRLLTATVLAASLASGAAFAQVGPYVGGSVGGTNYSIPSVEGLDVCALVSCDKSDVGFKVFGGYMFTPYLGAEIQYANYGKAKASEGGESLEIKTAGFGAFLVGQYPIDNFRLFGKIGMAYLDTEVSVTGFDTDSDKAANFAWGVGASYMFNKNLGVRAEYEQTKWEYYDGKDKVGFWSVGVQYRF